MPELPDITAYIDALELRILGHTLEDVRVASPFLLALYSIRRSKPRLGREVVFHRLGKRIAIGSMAICGSCCI
ncbi:MAG: hypothetical protein KF861_01065 [Planctomycetaceae bacterium]|nr:hypothetical protein [Planctomycetaceae bacterium]